MIVLAAVLLFVSAVFNVVTWPRFFKRVVADPRSRAENGARTPFYTVHLVLVVIGLAIAVASAIVGVLLLVVE